MKKLSAIVATAALLAPLSAMADPINWTVWGAPPGPANAAGLTSQNAPPVDVSYSRNYLGLDFGASYFANTTSFTNVEVSNPPGANGSVRMDGGGDGINHLHFSTPVTNPYMALYSLGQYNTPVSFNFLGG